jgi:hypothetical protein
MKSLLCFCALILVIGSAAPAHAYRINVLDPPTGIPVTSEPFSVVFTPCPANAANGCFFGVNETGSPISTLEIIFPNKGILLGQTPVCGHNGLSLFQSCTSQVINGYQVFFFNVGTIANMDPFLIQEEGISVVPDPNDPNGSSFPAGTSYSPAGFTPPAVAPEPNSIVLLSTGLLLGGFFFGRKSGLIPASLRSR